MANMASVSYRIEGPKETLEKINDAIVKAMEDKEHWTEWKACECLDIDIPEDARLGGEISEEPSLGENTLELYAEERWGLQDFEELLRNKFPEIKVYWIVEESGCEVYCTNDKEGKYFIDRYYVDTCIDDNYQSEYFTTKKDAYNWLSNISNGRIKNEQDVERFNADGNISEDDFVYVHEFRIIE